jgi:hypothetical protein
MMPLEPFELRDHHFARRNQRVGLLVRERTRHEDLGKARIGSSFLGRIVSGSNDQVMNYSSGALDPFSQHAAAMSVAQEEATCLSKLNGIGGLGDAGAQKEEHGARDGKIWTNGKLLSSTSP